MAYTNIDDPSAHFQATTYTGAGANTEVTNSGNSDLKPDFLWIKNRTAGYGHFVVDSNRNISYAQNSSNAPYLETESTNAENSNQNWMQSVNTDGFTTGISEHINNNSGSAYVAWQWKANGGSTTSVSASGTGANCINASTHQVNQDAGFSIITYTGRADQITVHQQTNLTHGLGVAPDLTIMKKRDATGGWVVMGKHVTTSSAYSANEHLRLDTSDAVSNAEYTGYVAPTSTYIYLGDALVNDTGNDYVCYAFAEKQGYSKFGKYVGNGSQDGPMVYTGFKPTFVIMKRTDNAGAWHVFDNKRSGYNYANDVLQADATAAELSGQTYQFVDLLSNGFKVRRATYGPNVSGGTYIYMAFAESPFTTSTGVPTTAR